MTDKVTTNVVYSGPNKIVVNLTNESDGTGESAVAKIDISTLRTIYGVAPRSVSLMEASWDVQTTNGGYVVMAWNHTTPDRILVMGGANAVSFADYGGLKDPKSAGGTGDVEITTDSFVDGDSYTITAVFALED